MRLRSIKITGLKGADGTPVALDAVTFFSGPNGSGKSTVLDGLRLLCRGEHPDAGRGGVPAKRADDILTMAAGDEIKVEAVLDTPQGAVTIGRSWERYTVQRGAGSGDIKTTSAAWVVPTGGRRIDKKSEAQAEIAKLVGPAAGLDLSELLGPKVTDTDRRRLLLTAAGSRSSWTPETVAEELERREITPPIKPWRGTPTDPALVDWIQAEWVRIGAEVSRTHNELLRAREAAEKIQQGQVEGEQPAVDPLAVQQAQQAVATAEERTRTVEARCTRSEISARGGVERAEASQATRRRAEVKLATVREQSAQARQQTGESPRIAELDGLIEGAEDELQDGSVPSLRTRLEGARGEADRLQDVAVQAAETERAARVTADRAVDAQRAAHTTAEEWRLRTDAEIRFRTEQLRSVCRRAETAAAPAQTLLRTVRRLLDEADELLEDEATCPTCGGTIDHSRLAALEAAAEEAGAPLRGAQDALDSAADQARSAVAERQRELDAARDAARTAAERAQDVTAPLAQATSEAVHRRQQAQETVRRLDRALSTSQAGLGRLKEELAAARATSADGELATLQERERALQAEVSGIHVPGIAGLRGVLEQAQAQGRRERQQAADEVAAARTELQPLEQALTLQREILRLRAEVDSWESDWREAQRVERELGPAGMMGAILSEILGPLELLVNEGLAGLNLGTFKVRMLDERGRPVCRPGLERGDRFTPVETLSDGERASVLPVLLPAIATLIGGPWRLMMADALERLDSSRRDLFVRRVVQMTADGKLDQALLAGCPDQAPQVDGCTVITTVGR